MEAFDWNLLKLLKNNDANAEKGKISPMPVMKTEEIRAKQVALKEIGINAIKNGEVAVVLLAGGQGSRLGYNGPKGTLDVGKTRKVYIFELLFKNLQETVKEAGAWVHLYIMTSKINHDETVAFLENNSYFGYSSEHVHFYIQEMLPSVDFNGKLWMSDVDSLAYSPNGNGGWFESLKKSGLLVHVHNNHIKWLNVISVDNVLQKIADPTFIGATYEAKATCGAKVIAKNNPRENVGVLCYEDGKPTIIEYYDLSDEMANLTNSEGHLTYGYGVILNYLFEVNNLEKIQTNQLPIHLAKKKIQYMNLDGAVITPSNDNGYKFEYLVLDMIKHMDSCLPYEVVRENEFAPVKNKTGVDSLESAQELLKANGVEI